MIHNVFYDGYSNKLFNIVNVFAYGAIGDGIADDTNAIQAALDALKTTGGTIHFPVGTYKISRVLYYYSNQSLVFENGARILQAASIDALMVSAGDTSITEYNGAHDVVIDGAIFDGGQYERNNTLLSCSHGKNIVIKNCKFVNSYGTWHNLEINSSKHVIIENCDFEGSRKTGSNGCMIQIDSYYDNTCYPWYTGAADGTACKYVEIKSCRFYDNTISPAIGNHSNGGSHVSIHDCVFEALTSPRGAICFDGITELDVYNNTFIDCTIGVANENAVVHENRFVGCGTAVNDLADSFNNVIDGAVDTGLSSSAVSSHNTDTSAHSDIRTEISKLSSEKVPTSRTVNGKALSTDITLSAADVGARPSTWMPSASDVGALPSTTTIPTVPTKVSAFTNDAGYLTEHQSLAGLASETYVSGQINTHNAATAAHNDIRLLIEGLTTRLNALANSDDTTLDQMSEVVAYIKNNKSLIDGITTSKVNVSDIINNLTTNVSNKPLSAAQGVALKALIDAIVVPTKVSELTNDKGYLTSVPVTSVNSKTGAVTLTASDVGALPSTTKIPASLSDLNADTTHRTVTDAEKSAWNAKAEASSIPTKVSQLTNDSKYLTAIPSEYVTETEMQNYAQPKGNYLTAVPSEYVTETELAKRGQLKPEFANSIEECTDTTKLYVLPDGFIYAYMLTEVEAGPAYTNLLPLATDASVAIYNGTGYKNGYRLNSSAVEKQQSGCGHTGFIPVKPGSVLRLKDIPACTEGYGYIHYFKSDKTGGSGSNSTYIAANTFATDANGVSSFTLPTASAIAYIRLSYGEMSTNSIITIDQEITEGGGTTTQYAWANTGHAFVPANYEGRIVAVENKATQNAQEIAKLKENGVEAKDTSLLFISPDGNDSNSGLTANTPKKTVKACVNAGATRISAKRGVYKEIVQLWDIGELEIFPTDNDLAYAVGEEREPIVFDVSDSVAVSSLAAYNSIKRVAYSNSANTQFDKVFTKKSQPPVVGDGYGSRYNSTIWLLSEDEKAVCIKLKPVLTVAECEAEANTFTYVSGYIYINANMASVVKVIVPTNWDSGFYVNGCERFVLKEVEVRFSGTYNIDIRNCAYFDFYKCACKYTSYGSGFHPFNSNGRMTACYATKNFDGYGISGYGHTTHIDCVSEFNFDDGISHHDGTSGTVIGGRYEGNGKGGNTPAYGAKVNIYGGLYKENASFGIGYLWASTHDPASGMVQGAVMVGNPIGLVVQANCPVTAMSCVYKNNTQDKENKGLLIEY